uniref:Uncharacterized protein n=1 Tax=Candidatus Kentrum sp. DK TaxID=2126562 RepID=A0A450T421_9GAMM|nr:MAG: hypothetical protein BECKDK2373C_GA0170839_108618 [Candidatus Kentron sp. DK]
MYTTSLPNHVSGVHIDRTFTNPNVILALRHMDENILAEMLDRSFPRALRQNECEGLEI